MPEIGTSGLMSEEGKRSDAAWPKPPRLSSTLPIRESRLIYPTALDCGNFGGIGD